MILTETRVNILANSVGGGGRNKGFLLFSTKKRGKNKEKVGEEIWNFGQNIYPCSVCVNENLLPNYA